MFNFKSLTNGEKSGTIKLELELKESKDEFFSEIINDAIMMHFENIGFPPAQITTHKNKLTILFQTEFTAANCQSLFRSVIVNLQNSLPAFASSASYKPPVLIDSKSDDPIKPNTTQSVASISSRSNLAVTTPNKVSVSNIKPNPALVEKEAAEFWEYLCNSFKLGLADTAWEIFHAFPLQDQLRIFYRITQDSQQHLLHAAIDAKLPQRIVKILQIDDEFHSNISLKYHYPLLTIQGRPNPYQYCKNKIAEETKQKKSPSNELIACMKILVNRPINENGDTPLYERVDAYFHNNDLNKNRLYDEIEEMVTRFDADFHLKNNAGHSSLQLAITLEEDTLLTLFLRNDKTGILPSAYFSQRTLLENISDDRCKIVFHYEKKQLMQQLYHFLQSLFASDNYGYAWEEVLAQTFSWQMSKKEGRKAPVTISLQEDISDGWIMRLKCPNSLYLIKIFEDIAKNVMTLNAMVDIKYVGDKLDICLYFSQSGITIDMQCLLFQLFTLKQQVSQLQTVITEKCSEHAVLKKTLSNSPANFEVQLVWKHLLAVVPVAPICQMILEYCFDEPLFRNVDYLLPDVLRKELIQQKLLAVIPVIVICQMILDYYGDVRINNLSYVMPLTLTLNGPSHSILKQLINTAFPEGKATKIKKLKWIEKGELPEFKSDNSALEEMKVLKSARDAPGFDIYASTPKVDKPEIEVCLRDCQYLTFFFDTFGITGIEIPNPLYESPEGISGNAISHSM